MSVGKPYFEWMSRVGRHKVFKYPLWLAVTFVIVTGLLLATLVMLPLWLVSAVVVLIYTVIGYRPSSDPPGLRFIVRVNNQLPFIRVSVLWALSFQAAALCIACGYGVLTGKPINGPMES